MELVLLFFFVYNPIKQLRPKLSEDMISLMNQDVKLLERKGIDNFATLQELDNQPLAKLQREVSENNLNQLNLLRICGNKILEYHQ